MIYEDVWGSGGIAQPFLTSALEGGEWSASYLGRHITDENRNEQIHVNLLGEQHGTTKNIFSSTVSERLP
jgi:hypothetical protein